MKPHPVEFTPPAKVSIDWFRSTPWWRIASQSLVIAWRGSHILLCAVALLVTQAWISGARAIFSASEIDTSSWLVPTNGVSFASTPITQGPAESPMEVWGHFLFPVMEWLGAPAHTLNGAAYCLACMIGIIAIWSFVGGCLARRSAVELGTQITAPWAETFKLVIARWQSIAWSVTMPGALILMIALIPLGLGWISNIPGVGIFLASVLLVPFLFCSIGIGWCAGITLFGFPLSVTAIVTEKKADAYDGISRSAAYTFQRPLTLGLCVLGAHLLCWIGGTMLAFVLGAGFSVIEAAFDIGSFSNLNELSPTWSPIFKSILPLLFVAFGFSFFWTASAGTYLILRKDVDHAEFDLIDMNVPDNPKPLPPLPKLETSSETKSESLQEPDAGKESPAL